VRAELAGRGGMSRATVTYGEVLKRRAPEFSQDAFLRAMEDTRPVLAYSDMGDLVGTSASC